MTTVKVQDIHLSDKTIYDNFKNSWKNGDYDDALQILEDNYEQLFSKEITADLINLIQKDIVDAEETALSEEAQQFKQNKIMLYDIVPTGLVSGTVWMEEI